MLQMAANAAVPTARPSRTAETSTSTLWAPGAPLLQEQPPCLVTAAPDSHQQQQPTQLQDALQGTQGSGTADWSEAQPAPRGGESEPSTLPTEAADEGAHAAAADSPEQSSVQSQAEDPANSGMPHSMQLPTQHGSHHDAHQPWATSWSQPALPALTVPTAQSGSKMPVKQQQHRRSTASDVPASRALQQQAMRNSSGLQAARSLSWSQSAAADQPLASRANSGVRDCIGNGVHCLEHQLAALARVTFLLAVKSICSMKDILGQVFGTCIVCQPLVFVGLLSSSLAAS